jgi:hypothetical protein
MNMRLLSYGVLGVLVLAEAGCDIGYNDDMIKKQELGRMNRAIPKATELPPGLGEDLPDAGTVGTTAASTQPTMTNQ